jgi:hypothetical protein
MRRLALVSILIASSAYAQTATVGPDTGFFRPTPNNDPSLTNFLVPLQPAAPQPQPQPQPFGITAPPLPAPAAVVVPVPVQAAPVPAAPVIQAEEQVDRAIREADQARAKAAAGVQAPIVGAFTGQTSERDR